LLTGCPWRNGFKVASHDHGCTVNDLMGKARQLHACQSSCTSSTYGLVEIAKEPLALTTC